MIPVALVLHGAPRTKKNHGQIVRGKDGAPRLLPSRAWRAWVAQLRLDLGAVIEAAQDAGVLPLRQPVNCEALIYRDARRGDAVGYYQGLADVLEELGVVDDDVRIESWDGSRLRVDRARPRVEVSLAAVDDD